MRLWSINPRHLDARGLIALWREGLLARSVLLGQTSGYRNHPQLERFRQRRNPVAALDCYLSRVLDEARRRGYRFNPDKICYRRCRHRQLRVTAGQIRYEWNHLLAKLAMRDRERWAAERKCPPQPHACFIVVPGPVAAWERVVSRK
ncbi:MAG: DNA lyase [Deltaproteobacteria bacterium]|nr:DNA lyase [Deltaproteobacteria bacterium]